MSLHNLELERVKQKKILTTRMNNYYVLQTKQTLLVVTYQGNFIKATLATVQNSNKYDSSINVLKS